MSPGRVGIAIRPQGRLVTVADGSVHVLNGDAHLALPVGFQSVMPLLHPVVEHVRMRDGIVAGSVH